MTLHTAKGLEFDTVFLTGLRGRHLPAPAGAPGRRASWRRSAGWRTSASPGPASGCYLSRAIVRAAWGAPQHNPPSRFLDEIPATPASTGGGPSAAVTSWRNTSATSTGEQGGENRVGYRRRRPKVRAVPVVAAGDRVLHTTFGMGTVLSDVRRRRRRQGRRGLRVQRDQAARAEVRAAREALRQNAPPSLLTGPERVGRQPTSSRLFDKLRGRS